ncbi:hypothetical protein LTR35_010728 [Friedmanniomyces endolithicus]|nr:hypothetical protein LTR35_010728 [Friedmanniomyces endolithicus]KAK0312129.1 hypothetical protein LTR01_003043 [Friedmanniomyces endolithicus]KAK0832363.1 hypothetical protein LTR73_002650 [Friedmanniomyces endolithicus]
MSPIPSELPFAPYGSTQVGSNRVCKSPEEKAKAWATPAEAPFLDFLYPPQALAWMKRTHGHQRERSLKRLPEGFTRPSRGYASRAPAQAEEWEETLQEQQRSVLQGNGTTEEFRNVHDGDMSGATAQVGGEVQTKDHQQAYTPISDNSTRPEAIFEELMKGRPATNNVRRVKDQEPADHDTPDFDTGNYADSPAELAEAVNDDEMGMHNTPGPGDGVENEDPARSLASIQSVLKMYDARDSARTDDPRLKSKMLIWLSSQRSSEADIRCAELYRSLPLEHRTVAVYQAALAVFLRRGLHVHAFRLHMEALKNVQDDFQLTKAFFEYTVEQQRWQLAINIEAQYRLRNAGGVTAFWQKVSETPGLLRKALDLAKHIQTLSKARTINPRARQFCGRFYAEALAQEIRRTDAATTDQTFERSGKPKGPMGRLFVQLDRLGDDAPRFYERMILSLINHRRSTWLDTRLYLVVSYAFLMLHNSEHHISEKVLVALLKTLTRDWETLQPRTGLRYILNVDTLQDDWVKHHGVVSKAAMQHLLTLHASRGRQNHFGPRLEYYKEHYPDYEDQKSVLASTVYLHARRCDLEKAQAAFDEAVRLTAQHNELPPLPCWNALIHAHSRTNDLEGGVRRLQALIDKGFVPTVFSFHPVTEILAKRGDVESVKKLLAQYDDFATEQHHTALTGSLLTALVNSEGIQEAEAVLKDLIEEVKSGKVRGALTGCFNILLTGHALRRDLDATMRTYRWMFEEGTRMDANTYAALIQAFTVHRQTNSAYKILRVVMRDKRLEPTAFHYALVMTGYVNQGNYDTALEVHQAMRQRHIEPTVSSNEIYLKAKALHEQENKTVSDVLGQEPTTLDTTIRRMKELLRFSSDGKELAAKQPRLGRGLGPPATASPAAYVKFLIYAHGRRRCLTAVKELFSMYQEKVGGSGPANADAPLSLLTTLMTANLQAKEHDEVERCWYLAKEQADELARAVPVPQLRPAIAKEGPQLDLLQIEAFGPADAHEVGFLTSDTKVADEQASSDHSSLLTAPTRALIRDGKRQTLAPKPIPARRHILSRPLRYYLYSLAAQGRTADILSTVTKILSQGYTLDNRTWNAFIELLCQASPPLVLLAFTLTERFLIPHFQGWRGTHTPKFSAWVERTQYTRAPHLRPGQLMPQYNTLVVLASALLKLRRSEATGRLGGETARGMEKYVGTARQVQQQAPKTVLAVRTMPAVDDAQQNKYLRRG